MDERNKFYTLQKTYLSLRKKVPQSILVGQEERQNKRRDHRLMFNLALILSVIGLFVFVVWTDASVLIKTLASSLPSFFGGIVITNYLKKRTVKQKEEKNIDVINEYHKTKKEFFTYVKKILEYRLKKLLIAKGFDENPIKREIQVWTSMDNEAKILPSYITKKLSAKTNLVVGAMHKLYFEKAGIIYLFDQKQRGDGWYIVIGWKKEVRKGVFQETEYIKIW